MKSPAIDAHAKAGHPTPLAGSLWAAVVRQTQRAIACGALQPINSEVRSIDQAGIRFLVRVASNLQRKDAARAREQGAAKTSGSRVNPFQPYEEALFVGDLTPTHFCLLNKYNVLDHHLLIVTRDYIDQQTLISDGDFEALCFCLAQIDGLGFYNAGPDAGASQPHKHLQLIPLPLLSDERPVPVEAAFDATTDVDGLTTVPAFPFRHAFAHLDPSLFDHAASAAKHVYTLYRQMLAFVGIGEVADGSGRQSQAYNLLLTRRWMLLVPRSIEFFAGVSISALNFAGSMFVRSEEQLRTIEDAGPLAVLASVGVARDAGG